MHFCKMLETLLVEKKHLCIQIFQFFTKLQPPVILSVVYNHTMLSLFTRAVSRALAGLFTRPAS